MRYTSRRTRNAFTLPELLVVIGVIALLIALIIPPLQIAKRHGMRAQCMARLQQVGLALEAANSEYGFYPLWDDHQDPIRYTWVDVLVQRRMLADYRAGYCPEDNRPDPLNAARGAAQRVFYPGSSRSQSGIDYSFGIGVPLSAGGWKWVTGYSPNGDERQRIFEGRGDDTGRRVLAGDANWSYIYNLSGDATLSNIWNDPNWYDNTIAWRHGTLSANLLLQDGHVASLNYHPELSEPVKTSRFFVWYSGEPLHVGPDSSRDMNYYPDQPPPRYDSVPRGDMYPDDLDPAYYSMRGMWTLIRHKGPAS